MKIFCYEGQDNLVTLSQSLVEEALIVSDLFKLNELSSLQLLLHGEEQLPQYPGLTRGENFSALSLSSSLFTLQVSLPSFSTMTVGKLSFRLSSFSCLAGPALPGPVRPAVRPWTWWSVVQTASYPRGW